MSELDPCLLLRMVGILAGALRRVREEPALAEEIAARIERAEILLKGGPRAADAAERHLAACEKLLGW